MKTLSKITILLVSATLAGAAFARGPGGGGMGGGGMGGGMGMSSGSAAQSQSQYQHQYRHQSGEAASMGQGTQTRAQMRDPASNPTGQPIQQRDRIHTPGTGLSAPALATTN